MSSYIKFVSFNDSVLKEINLSNLLDNNPEFIIDFENKENCLKKLEDYLKIFLNGTLFERDNENYQGIDSLIYLLECNNKIITICEDTSKWNYIIINLNNLYKKIVGYEHQ